MIYAGTNLEVAMALERTVQSVAIAAQRLLESHSPDLSSEFEELIQELIHCTSTVDPCARLHIDMPHLKDLLQLLPPLLLAPSTGAVTRSKIHLLFFNLAWHNVPLRRVLAGELQICGPLFHSLKMSIREQLGPQNLIDILRVIQAKLQVLTYERTVTLGAWTNDLISFLLGEICRSVEQEWMPYCMAVLCNLASRSKSVCLRIRKSTSYKNFCKILMKLLAHDSRIVVVAALILVGYLEEKLRDTVFCSQNIQQTFQCVFNVLILGDFLMTRHIAVDLLRRLIIAEPITVSSVPIVTAASRDLVNYPFYERSIQQVANILVHIDVRSEESLKVFELLESLCCLEATSLSTANAVLAAGPVVDQRLTTPLLAICRTAALSFEDAIMPDVPLSAIRLLTLLLKKAIDGGTRLQNFLPPETVVRLIEMNLQTPIETSSRLIACQCRRITDTLRLVEVISNDEEMRNDLLEVVTAPLCAHLVESQLLLNPVGSHLTRPASTRNSTLPGWSGEGVAIVLELLKVLAALKDYSKMHKDQYWRSLKDERLLPFVAFAIAAGQPDLVNDALLLYTHCAQVHAFPTQWLGDLIANCSLDTKLCQSAGVDDASVTLRGGNLRERDSTSSIEFVHSNGTESNADVHSISNRLQNGLAVEQRCSHSDLDAKLQLKEQELKRAVAERDALSMKLRDAQSACDDKQILLDAARHELATKIAIFHEEKKELLDENSREREMQLVIRKRYDEMKEKFETASRKLLECENRLQATHSEKFVDPRVVDNMNNQLLNEKSIRASLETTLDAQSVRLTALEAKEARNAIEIKRWQSEARQSEEEKEHLKKELEKVSKFKEQMMRMMKDM